MPDLAYENLRSSLAAQPLFEDKSWQLSPQAWPLTRAQVAELEQIGTACLEFQQSLETLYLRSVAGKNLLRNKPLLAPWVADYLDRGKPARLVAHARDPKNRGILPSVLRPDLLLTEDGFALTELDSVPGGIGLTAFLNRLYATATQDSKSKIQDPKSGTRNPELGTLNSGSGTPNSELPTPNSSIILGENDAMVTNFYLALAALLPDKRNPLVALVVSEEAATYRPEMQWLAAQLQLQGKRVYCLTPDDLFPLGGALFFDSEGSPERIDIIYRFFELFDLENIKTAPFIFEAWAAGEVAIAPPMRHFQEEKLALALFHHHLLQEFWLENLSGRSLKLLRKLIPPSWVIDPSPLPPSAVLDGPLVGNKSIYDWRQLGLASQKERDLIIKISGFHETAWGARSVILGSDCSREEWQAGIEQAIGLAPTNLHVLQTYQKPVRVKHRIYRQQLVGGVPSPRDGVDPIVADVEGRLRLCPYYFNLGGKAVLSGALATFCPPDKKIIHGMQDAALLPCRIVE